MHTHLGDTPDKVNIIGGLQDNAEYREARKSSDKIEGNSIDSKELKMQTGGFSFVKLQYYNKQVEEGTVINEKSLQDGVSLDGMFARTLYDEKIVDGISFHSNALQSSFGIVGLDLLYIINKLEIKNFFLDMLSGEPTVKQVTRSSKMIFLFVR